MVCSLQRRKPTTEKIFLWAGNSWNSVSLESLLVIPSEASKNSLQGGAPPIWPLLLYSSTHFSLQPFAQEAIQGEVLCLLRSPWKRVQEAGVGEKQPERNFF